MENNKVLIIIGPSGVGKVKSYITKGTLIEYILNEFKGKFIFSVSHTTRSTRDGEVNGTNYHFVPREKFEEVYSN
jgi:guanylate kinase